MPPTSRQFWRRASSTQPARRLLALGIVALGACSPGTFTNVPMPEVSEEDQRGAARGSRPLSVSEFNEILRRNYYAIAYDEESPSSRADGRDAYVQRMMAADDVSPVVLSSLTPEQASTLARSAPVSGGPASPAAARAPLEKRLLRVADRVARAAGRNDLRFMLSPTAGLNAGAVAGFDSKEIVVGPQLVAAAETPDALAFILGHEVAHIEHHHTRSLAVQNVIVGTLQVASAVAVGLAMQNDCRHGGRCASSGELGDAMAGAAGLTRAVAHGAVTASGYSRDEEREADYFGLQYARMAGYDPQHAPAVFRTLLSLERGTGSTASVPLLNSHPELPERIARLQKWIGGTGLAAVAPAPASRTQTAGTYDPLGRLAVARELHRKRLITDEEYRAKKRAILDLL